MKWKIQCDVCNRILQFDELLLTITCILCLFSVLCERLQICVEVLQ